MPLPPLPDSAIQLGATAADWRAAVRLAGARLSDSGAARPGYADEMIRMIEDHGPYVVIAPGLALAHARPGPEVVADGLSVVLGLAVTDARAHLGSVAELANVFNDSTAIEDLAAAETTDDVHRILGSGS